MSDFGTILLAVSLPLVGTTLGAASVWSLLIPAMDMAEAAGEPAWLPAVVGFLGGGWAFSSCWTPSSLTSFITPILPCILAFAAGAMLYVVVEELIPETQAGEHSNIGIIGVAQG